MALDKISTATGVSVPAGNRNDNGSIVKVPEGMCDFDADGSGTPVRVSPTNPFPITNAALATLVTASNALLAAIQGLLGGTLGVSGTVSLSAGTHVAQTPNKTVQTDPITWMDLAAGAAQRQVTPLDGSGKFAIGVAIQLGRESGTAFSASPVVEVDVGPTVNGPWVPVLQYPMQLGSSVANTTLNGAVAALATQIVVTSATGISVGDSLFLKDTSPTNYEIVRVKAISGTTITTMDPVANPHATGSQVTNQAEQTNPGIDLSVYKYVSVLADNTKSGQQISVRVGLVTLDSLS